MSNIKEIVFATGNVNKIVEVQAILGDEFLVKSSLDLGVLEDIPENEDTLHGNALEKSRYIYERFGCDCFADDTGLEVEALNGAPGVYSARYAGEGKSPVDNMNLLLTNMKDEENRKAQFRTVISLIKDGEEFFFEGSVKGVIRQKAVGVKGFGYDPIFEPENSGITFAEMTLKQKNKISHRSRAIEQLVNFLKIK